MDLFVMLFEGEVNCAVPAGEHLERVPISVDGN